MGWSVPQWGGIYLAGEIFSPLGLEGAGDFEEKIASPDLREFYYLVLYRAQLSVLLFLVLYAVDEAKLMFDLALGVLFKLCKKLLLTEKAIPPFWLRMALAPSRML